MSKRDDELLTMLRAELARRATTTPREGFDMRMHNTVRGLQKPRGRGHRLLGVGLAVATVAAAAVAVTAGLRLHQDNRGATPPAPAPSPAPKGDLFVLVEPGRTGVNYSAATIRFVRHDGTLARAFPFPGGPDANHEYEIAAGDQLFYVTPDAHYELQSVGIDGVVHDHGSAVAQGESLAGVAVRPDGEQWAWLDRQDQAAAGSKAIHQRLHVAGGGQPAHVILDATVPLTSGYPPYTNIVVGWTDRGILLVQSPMGVGGGAFQGGYWGAPRLVDPLTGAVQSLDDPKDSTFYGMGSDGTYANVVGPSTVNVVDPRGGQRHATIADPVLTAFAALVAPDGVHVAVGVRVQDVGPDGGPVIRTDVLDVSSGQVSHVVPAHYAPIAWLADGSLVVFAGSAGPAGSPEATAPTTVEVLAPSGQVTNIGPGDYIGVIHG